MKILLCVAEKPSVARTAASILSKGNFEVEDTRDQYVKNYTFRSVFQDEEVDVVFTSVKGHLFELDFPEEKKSWFSTDPLSLFTCQVVSSVPQSMKAVLDNLNRISRRASILMLWLDNDREGENISEEVEGACLKANPRLTVRRARFSALSAHDVFHAFNNPTNINRADSLAVKLRSETDLRTGAAFTRFQTTKFRSMATKLTNDLSEDDKRVLSYGTCQFPTLGFIVDAYVKHNAFTPEKFWYISCSLKKEGMICELKWFRKHLFCKLSVFALYASVLDNPEATVVNIERKQVQKERPYPLATVEFQRRVSKYLKIDPHTAMNIAEKIYASGYISYPRTETDSYPPNFDYQDIVNNLSQCSDPNIAQYAQNLQWVQPKSGRHTDNAHPPIYPLKPPNNLAGDDLKIYNFIARHFLATISKNAIGEETKVYYDVGGENFTLKGLHILERNFLDIYPYIPWNGNIIPSFSIGEKIKPIAIKMLEGTTTAPPLLSEPDLIKLMDKEGIGTDATIAEHIQKIISRNYTEKRFGNFYPTKLGLALIIGYQQMGFDFDKPKLRADLEKTMQQISKHPEVYNQEKNRIIDEYKNAFSTVSDMSVVLEKSFRNQINSPDPIPQGGEPPPIAQARQPQTRTIRGRGRGGNTRGRGNGRGGARGTRR